MDTDRTDMCGRVVDEDERAVLGVRQRSAPRVADGARLSWETPLQSMTGHGKGMHFY